MKSFVIVQTGEPLRIDEGDSRPMRAENLASALATEGYHVHIVAPRFFHQTKRHRQGPFFIRYDSRVTYHLIDSPGYKTNISAERFFDHFVLAIRTFAYLCKSGLRPCAIFIGYPPIDVSLAALIWAKLHGIESFLDVKDSWPSMFIEYLPSRYKWAVRLALTPYYIMSFACFRLSDNIVSMSVSYLGWVSSMSARKITNDNSYLLPLIPPSMSRDESCDRNSCAELRNLAISKPFFCFVGSLTNSFDFGLLKDAFVDASAKVDVNLIIAGSGAESDAVAALFQDVPNVYLVGWIDSEDVRFIMSLSLCLVAPYRPIQNFTMNIPNKIIDSMASGSTFLTSLPGEVAQLIELHQCGLGCKHNYISWSQAMQRIIDDQELRSLLKSNATNLYQSEYTFERTYSKFARKLSGVRST